MRLVAALAAAVAAGGLLATNAAPAARSVAQQGVITIVVANSGGPFASQDRAIVNGAIVAVREINAKGGVAKRWRIRLVQGKLDGLSAASMRKLLRVRLGASAVILPCDSGAQTRVATAAANAGVLMLAPCNSWPAYGGRWPNYWPVTPGANAETAGLINQLKIRINQPRAFIVNWHGTGYVASLTDYFRRSAAVQHLRVVGAATLPIATKDYSAVARLIAVTSPKPTFIYTALYPPHVNRLALALRRAHISLSIFGTTAMDNTSLLATGRTSSEGLYFSSYGFLRASAAARKFSADYRELTRKSIQGSFPGLGFDTIRLLANLATKVHSKRASSLVAGLNHGFVLHGVGLADRRWVAGGDHNPIAEMGVSKVFDHQISPLIAVLPTGVPQP